MTSQTRLDELKTFVQTQSWQWRPGKAIDHGEQIVVMDGAYQVSVNFYHKRGRIVLGGSDSPLKNALAAWLEGETVPDVASPAPSPLAQPTSNRLDDLKAFLQEQGWHWGPGAEIPHGEQILVSDAGTTVLVNFWSKRGKMQVQGKESSLKAALRAWVDGGTGGASGAAAKIFTAPHVGMDESGKGDWFGPLVVAAVYVDERATAALDRLGVRDSKTLDATTIQRLAGQIERLVPQAERHVWAIEPETYNQLYQAHGNINLLLANAYAQVAEHVREGTQAETIVCDQFSQRADRLENAFAVKDLPRPIQQHKAESASIAVAAASILASSAFAEALKEMGYQVGLGEPLPKGASDVAALEGAARHIIESHGIEALEKYAKLNFKPVQALIGGWVPEPSAGSTESQARNGPPIKIQTVAWEVQYHPNGFWRYTFQDGGFLDWWEGSERGTIYVHGKPGAESISILRPKTAGKSWHGEREKLDEAVENHIPRRGEQIVPSVLGVGWRRSETVLGARFGFTDGGVLNYYQGKGTLTIQGTPSSLTRVALGALPSPFWSGLDELDHKLRDLFPDWRMGQPASVDGVEGDRIEEGSWSPMEGALNWPVCWPEDREMRQATNEKAPCQRAMVDDWASVLTGHEGKRHLLAHAPTGLGKTLAALVPALAWVAGDPDQRCLYYLVNRVTQHDNPLRELRAGLGEAFEAQTGRPLRVVDMVGRHLLCRHPQARKLPDMCKESRNAASFDLLPDGIASWEEVKTQVGDDACPYHILQGLMAQAHIVVCDYWWLFSQMAQERSRHGPSPMERAGFSPETSIVVVDEAHNLPLRVRAELDVDQPVERITEAMRQAPQHVHRCLEPVVTAVQGMEPEKGAAPSEMLPLTGGAGAVQAALEALADDETEEAYATVPERMLRMLLQPDEAVVIYPTEDIEGEQRLVFRLVDPTSVLQRGYGQAYASLSMSGTLAAPSDDSEELRYQVPLFGLPLRQTVTRKYASPFPLRNQRWIYCTDTMGTYRERDTHMARYAEHIVNVGQVTPGVTAVFFSSYAFLEKVRDTIADRNERELIISEARVDAEAALDTLAGVGGYEERLRELVARHGRAYLFAAYKGKLSEGADFAGNLIKAVICVSIPMEYPGLFHERLQALYQQAFSPIAEERGDSVLEKAREYALGRLSISLVLQACGRGIRHEQDHCAFVLLDKRYHDHGWRRFLKSRPYNVGQPETSVRDFHRDRLPPSEPVWDSALICFAETGGNE